MSPFVNIITDLIKMALIALLTKLGFDVAAHAGDIQSVAVSTAAFLATAAVTAGLVAWRWLRHTQLWNQLPVVPPQSPPNGGSASRGTAHVLLLVLCLLPCMLGGCGLMATPTPATPQDAEVAKVDQAMEAYLVLSAPVDAAIAAGEIKGSAADAIGVIEARIVAHFSAARAAASAGSSIDADAQLQLFEDDRTALIDAVAAARGTAATQTQP